MSALQMIESQILSLPRDQAAELQDWLSDYLEDQAELNPDFLARLDRAQEQLTAGDVRVFHP